LQALPHPIVAIAACSSRCYGHS